MIISQGKPTKDGKYEMQSNVLLLRWREQNDAGSWIRKEKVVRDFKPYGYINPECMYECVGSNPYSSVSYRKLYPSQVEELIANTRGATLYRDTDAVSADDVKLWKVEFDSPTQMGWFRRKFNHNTYNLPELDGLYEFDVPYTDRYLIDNVDRLPSYKPRILYFDLEATQYREPAGPRYPYLERPGHEVRGYQEINTIGCYDNYSEQYIIWFQHPDLESTRTSEEFDEVDVLIRKFSTEKAMLEDFVDWLDVVDPDIMTAWASGFYDFPTLYTRLEATGVGGHRLSPSSLGFHQHMSEVRRGGRIKGQYSGMEQCINGRIVTDLKEVFARVFKDSTSQDPPSNSLDGVGKMVFGRGKTDWKPDFFDTEYVKDEWKFLYYNFRDIQLMVEIDDKYNVLQGQMSMQELGRCSYSSTLYVTGFARVYLMRNANFKQRTGKGFIENRTSSKDYEGAIVLDPAERDGIGLSSNVAIIDYAGLYPAMMVCKNIDYTTIVRD